MKKAIAVLSAITISFTFCPSGAVVWAGENEGKLVGIEKNSEEKPIEDNEEKNDVIETEDSISRNIFGNFFDSEEKEATEKIGEKTQKAVEKESVSQVTSELKNLQIPEKLDVVIDPWEMDKKGQVYSEPYIICNTGEAPGILTLSHLACKPREQSGVVVTTDKTGLHDSGDKSIYMEMLFGNGDQIVFSAENSQYQTELKPGEELSIWFSGEVNENTFGKWENGDIAVSVVYSWETEEAISDINLEESEEEQTDLDAEELAEQTNENIGSEELKLEEKRQNEVDLENLEGELKDNPEIDNEEQESNENKGDMKEATSDLSGDTILQNQSSDFKTDGLKVSEDSYTDGDIPSENPAEAGIEDMQTNSNSLEEDNEEKEEIKYIELQEPQEAEVLIDSWKLDEKGQIVSMQYVLCNNSDTVGIWNLSELVCKPQEQSSVAIVTDKKRLHDAADKAVYMELVLDNGENLVLSREKSQYQVELKPGEKLSVRFIGETNGYFFETNVNEEITVMAVSSWNIEGASQEQ